MKEIRIRDPFEYLDFNNWSKGFARFYEISGLISDLELIGTTVNIEYSKSEQSWVLQLNSIAKDQLTVIYLISKMDNRVENLIKTDPEELKSLLKSRAKMILGSTIDKLKILKTDLEPNGYKDLTKEVVYIKRQSRSVESYDNHRIVYDLFRLPYIVPINSVIGHYSDSPLKIKDPLIKKLELRLMDCIEFLTIAITDKDYENLDKLLSENQLFDLIKY